MPPDVTTGATAWLGSWWATSDYDVAREVAQRGVAVLLCLAFVQALTQFRPLLGAHGLLPVPRLTARVRFRDAPSLFHAHYSDRLLVAVAATGVVLAAAVVAGVPQLGPWWVTTLALLVAWFAYLSLANVGQRFYGYGWEMLLCEAAFLVAWLGSPAVPVPVLLVVALRWLLFRLELGAGLIKWRGDPAWRDLTALDYHHETQPMPGPFSWHAHHLPRWWHRTEVVGNHVTQLLVPWLLWLPQPLPSVAGVVVVLTQGWLVLTGNFAWLNWAAIVLGAAMVSDDAWAAAGGLLGIGPPASATIAGVPTAPPPSFVVAATAAAVLLAVLSVRPALNLASRHQRMNASFEPWRLVNAYGAFGSMTRHRDEVVLEGTLEAVPGPADWREYGFRGKPGDVRRRPPQVAPYHLRLDWQMWFLALGASGRWFEVLLARGCSRPTRRPCACCATTRSTARALAGCAPSSTATGTRPPPSVAARAPGGCVTSGACSWIPWTWQRWRASRDRPTPEVRAPAVPDRGLVRCPGSCHDGRGKPVSRCRRTDAGR